MVHLRSQLGLAAIVVAAVAGLFLYRTLGASDGRAATDLAVTCGLDHRAIVRQAAGQAAVSVDCVPAASLGALASALPVEPGAFSTVAAQSPGAPLLVPAVYSPQPRVERAVTSAPRRVSSRTSSPSTARRVDRKTASWQKRALVIGGSAGAGAGIGALIGGKKGALIGAAVGGGGATVVDLLKNR